MSTQISVFTAAFFMMVKTWRQLQCPAVREQRDKLSHIQVVVVYLLTCVGLSATPWTAAHQAPLSMGFPRQGHWSGVPFSPPGGLSDPRIKPASPRLLHCGGTLYCRATREPYIQKRTIPIRAKKK